MKSLIILIVLTSFLISESVWQKPAFCGTDPCPEYEVAEKGNGYEKRHYTTATWISTSAGGNYEQASKSTYTKLTGYLNGDNKDGKKFPMAFPYVTMIFPTVGQSVMDNFTMFFFIAPSSGKASQPNDASIDIKEVPPKFMYIRPIPGKVSTTAQWVTHANELRDAINDTSKYYPTFFFTAAYNLPNHSGDNYNEVWFYANTGDAQPKI